MANDLDIKDVVITKIHITKPEELKLITEHTTHVTLDDIPLSDDDKKHLSESQIKWLKVHKLDFTPPKTLEYLEVPNGKSIPVVAGTTGFVVIPAVTGHTIHDEPLDENGNLKFTHDYTKGFIGMVIKQPKPTNVLDRWYEFSRRQTVQHNMYDVTTQPEPQNNDDPPALKMIFNK